MVTEALWKSLAIELAEALDVLPCTCVKRVNQWPIMKANQPDFECRRCRVLAKYQGLLNAQSNTVVNIELARAPARN
jgi:hypothetical protein